MMAIAETQNKQNIPDGKQKLTFEQFIELCPAGKNYEFVNGQIVNTSGNFSCAKHDDAVELIALSLAKIISLLSSNYGIEKKFRINPQLAFFADLCVSNKTTQSPSIQVVIEVVSFGWEDDYIDKFDEYQRLGIPEYWIVDYMAIASRDFLGNPKIPTVFVNLLDENGKYQTTKFTGDVKIISRTFPELDLTAAQILNI